ncbi:MAG: hypothetical protein KQA38_00985 [Candidatus Aenigmarchaeota archaeon]|nr:hypothetical protein [Candidatus Aenigmarchaeota archaeon]
MKVVLDTSAIIYLNDFRIFDEIFTVSEVIDEVKDKINMLKLAGMKFKIVDPTESSVNEVKETAKETGDLEKLSKADIKILALAKENKLDIVSDDYSIQNVAEKLGINYISLFSKKITKFIRWGLYCGNCKNFSKNKKVCSKCGNKLTRRPVSEEFIKNKN